MIFWTHINPAVGTPPDDWPAYSWFAVWDQLVGLPCDLEVGGEVILVDESGVATWRTVVTDLVAFPFEHIDSALDELRRRWSINPIWDGPSVAPGMLIAWRARPVAHLGVALPNADNAPAFVCDRCGDDEVRQWLAALPALPILE